MIARLAGTLLELDRGRLLLAADEAVTYEVLIPAYLSETLTPRLGETVLLETIHYLEQQGQGTAFIPRLLGFGSLKEKAFFETFTGVKGLGMKRALRALAMPPGMVARMIAEADARALTRLPEIGKKLADTIVLELKDSVDEFLEWSAPSSPTSKSTDVEAQGRGGGLGLRETGANTGSAPAKKSRSSKRVSSSSTPIVETKPETVGGSNPLTPASSSDPFLAARAASREAVETLIALGEQPLEAERLVGRVMESARRKGEQPPVQASAILTAAYAARRG